MAGIYIHVPYCKTRCIYCDFFTQIDSSSQNAYIESVVKEISLRKNYLNGEQIKTIYWGGGTPSQLYKSDFEKVFNTIYESFEVDSDVEITLEANPDDLTEEYFSMLRNFPFNRLSIGIQSFDDKELKFLNRRHDSSKAIKAVQTAQDFGFDNISIDLIYGLPNQTMSIWENNLEQALRLDVQHISSYHLIYEEKTMLYSMLKKKMFNPIDEDISLEMFSKMIDTLEDHGFEHYEISNFARDGKYSKHNTSYWLDKKYLGLGPAAHSFDGENRAWNIASISKYIDGINTNKPNMEIEILDKKSQYNDHILTRLRTKWGVDLEVLENKFGDFYKSYFLENINKHIVSEAIIKEKNVLKLSRKGIFISDDIMSDLMYVD